LCPPSQRRGIGEPLHKLLPKSILVAVAYSYPLPLISTFQGHPFILSSPRFPPKNPFRIDPSRLHPPVFNSPATFLAIVGPTRLQAHHLRRNKGFLSISPPPHSSESAGTALPPNRLGSLTSICCLQTPGASLNQTTPPTDWDPPPASARPPTKRRPIPSDTARNIHPPPQSPPHTLWRLLRPPPLQSQTMSLRQNNVVFFPLPSQSSSYNSRLEITHHTFPSSRSFFPLFPPI